MTKTEAIELLKAMIALPSPSGAESKVADLLQSQLESDGYAVSRKGNNVWVKTPYYDPLKPTILLDAHIDTVQPHAGWVTDPFSPTVQDGKLIGLGSNDTGGSVVAMLAAFSELVPLPQSYNLVWLASAEEENTGAGGIQSILNDLGNIDLAIVGEPTGMQPAIAEKGLMVVDCITRGKAGHAARQEGINAIYEALPDIEWCKTYQFPQTSPWLGAVQMTVTGIEAGSLHNVVPAECRWMVDVRINECYSNQSVLEIIRTYVKSEVQPRSFRLNSSFIPEDHPFVQRCKAWGLTPYGSPTTSNQAVIPYTSVKLGPGDSARSHTAGEYICLKEIEEGIDLFIQLLNGFNF